MSLNVEQDTSNKQEEQSTDQNQSAEHIRDPLTSDYVAGVKERSALKEEVAELSKELNHVKGQNYDLLKKIEILENENAELKKGHESKKNGKRKKAPAKRKIPKTNTGEDKKTEKRIEVGEHVFENTDLLYEEIAKRHSTLPLSTILMAQQKFTEADVNNDGTIDSVELEKMLDSASLLFTKADIKKILSDIDADSSNSLDFFECLQMRRCAAGQDHFFHGRKINGQSTHCLRYAIFCIITEAANYHNLFNNKKVLCAPYNEKRWNLLITIAAKRRNTLPHLIF